MIIVNEKDSIDALQQRVCDVVPKGSNVRVVYDVELEDYVGQFTYHGQTYQILLEGNDEEFRADVRKVMGDAYPELGHPDHVA